MSEHLSTEGENFELTNNNPELGETSPEVDEEHLKVLEFDARAGFTEDTPPPAEDVLEQLKNRDPELAALVEAGQASLIPETIE